MKVKREAVCFGTDVATAGIPLHELGTMIEPWKELARLALMSLGPEKTEIIHQVFFLTCQRYGWEETNAFSGSASKGLFEQHGPPLSPDALAAIHHALSCAATSEATAAAKLAAEAREALAAIKAKQIVLKARQINADNKVRAVGSLKKRLGAAREKLRAIPRYLSRLEYQRTYQRQWLRAKKLRLRQEEIARLKIDKGE